MTPRAIMARALAICLGLLIGLPGLAWADKPRIAVLGLEPASGPGGVVDPGAQLIAKEITKELRQRVAIPASPYIVAPNSSKDLSDEKLLMSCDNEALDCMVVIGAGLASDVLLYGRVDKRGETFRVSLKLLDVKRRTVQATADDLPVGGAVSGVSRRLYNKLIGDGRGSEGTLVIRARSDSGAAIRTGAVKVDDEPRGQLTAGRLSVPELSDGQHSVAIEVPGHRRFEEIVTVRGGEQATLDAVLHAEAPARPDRPEPPVTSHRRSSLWKWGAIAGAAIALGGGGFAFYAYDREINHYKIGYTEPDGMAKRAPDSSDCGKTEAQIRMDTKAQLTSFSTFQHACTWQRWTQVGIGVAIGGGLVAIGSLIMLSRDSGSPDAPTSDARSKKPEVALVPILAPGLAGAQLSLDW